MPIKQLFFGLIILLMLFSKMAWAYLDGKVDDNGDGTYTVEVDSLNGHRYEGIAVPQCDGTLRINLHDHDDASYSGLGFYRGSDVYDVTYQNDTTGHLEGGKLIVD